VGHKPDVRFGAQKRVTATQILYSRCIHWLETQQVKKFRAIFSSQNFTSGTYPEAVKSNYTFPADGISHLEKFKF
jgi:hypothetical protein